MTVMHDKLSSSQKRKRGSIEDMNKNKNHFYKYSIPVSTNSYITYTEERTSYRNKMAENDVKICNYPISTKETTKDNIVSYPKYVEMNFNTEQPQSTLNIASNSV